ncbi:hypothetical protein [Streptacidiphilus cavernicola]|uniref:LPXTG cell wall anchor domain-containing protein n=1 Tax=Streptacidiphilus cavernicola TaxID=3342716 RepID=A0ABV6W3L6_9ACTN
MGQTGIRRTLGVLAAVATASTAVLVGAGTAFASDQLNMGEGEYGLTLPTAVNGTSVEKVLHVWASHDQGGEIPTATLTVDVSGLNGVATVDWPANCTHSGSTGTCTLEHLPGANEPEQYLGLGLKADPKAAAGAKGSIGLKLTAPGYDAVEDSSDIQVGSGADMTIQQLPTLTHVKVGSTLSEPIEWSNTGNETAPSSVLTFQTTAGLQYKQSFSNCLYSKPDGSLKMVTAVCTVNQPLAPGKALRLTSDIKVGVTKEARYALMSAAVLPPGDANTDTRGYAKGTGAALTAEAVVSAAIRPQVADINPRDSYTELDITADNTADFAAVGTSLKGNKGQTVSVTVGARNNGPALIYDRSGGEGTGGYKVTFPAGATVTKIPSDCTLDNRTGVKGRGPYNCPSDYVQGPGYQKLVTFKVRLDAQLHDAKGTVALDNEYSYITGKPASYDWDKNPADDSAPIVFNGPATKPSAGTTATASGSASAAAPAPTSAQGGDLAQSGGGSDSLPLGIAGAAAVAIGAGAVVFTRRRRAGVHH